MLKSNFVTAKQAMSLKEIGYDVPSIALYILGDLYFRDLDLFRTQPDSRYQCLAPLKQEALCWFRNNCELSGYVSQTYDIRGQFWSNQVDNIRHKTYEDAEENLLSYFISILENKSK